MHGCDPLRIQTTVPSVRPVKQEEGCVDTEYVDTGWKEEDVAQDVQHRIKVTEHCTENYNNEDVVMSGSQRGGVGGRRGEAGSGRRGEAGSGHRK